jgi:hypothetical protein
MEDLFRQFWWLLFPLAWFVVGAFNSFLNYRRQRETLKLIKFYADKGQEPPESLLKLLDRPIDAWDESRRYAGVSSGGPRNDGNWFSVVLFGLLAAGFGYAAWTDMYGAGDAFIIVAFVLGALAAASLVSALLSARRANGRPRE